MPHYVLLFGLPANQASPTPHTTLIRSWLLTQGRQSRCVQNGRSKGLAAARPDPIARSSLKALIPKRLILGRTNWHRRTWLVCYSYCAKEGTFRACLKVGSDLHRTRNREAVLLTCAFTWRSVAEGVR